MLFNYNTSEKQSLKQKTLLEKHLSKSNDKKINHYIMPADLKAKIQSIIASSSAQQS